VGAFVERLRGEGLLDRTILVITSDHGENLGDHGMVDHMFSIHRSIRHVPLLTLLAACGLEPFIESDGISLLGDLAGRSSRGAADPPIDMMERLGPKIAPGADLTHRRVSIRAIFDGRHHYIRYSDGREELYDIENDPGEQSDIAPAGGEVLERLRQRLEDG